LKVGDPAPKLQVGKWVQGEPLKSFEKDKAYIVEFWATWCGPCRVSIPHLNEIHNKFKDKSLVVIGQDCWERDESAVEPFIKKMADKMTYRVALDDKTDGGKGKMAETWMEAAGQNGIPAAFLINKEAKIVWIGHPMELEEKTIEKVLAGKYDAKEAAKAAEEKEKNQAELTKLSSELMASMQAKEWDKAEATLTQMEQKMPENFRSGAEMARLKIMLAKGDEAKAVLLANTLSDKDKENAVMQNELAWSLVTAEGIKDEGLGAAAKIANRANDAAKGKDPAILDTLARVLLMQGKKEQAVETQQKAVDLAEGDMKDALQKTLDSYKEGKLPTRE
jgi:thiol-disulfide isomerase/thioredoxin